MQVLIDASKRLDRSGDFLGRSDINVRVVEILAGLSNLRGVGPPIELSPNFGDGPRVQAAAVWDCEDAGLAATSIPSV
ncbi:MAG: hypothetical protein WB611_22300, partial [Stellaceae bacterium]